MKKTSFTLAILLFSGPLWADTVTSGALGLLKPTTGVIDTQRSWADKVNKNFDMIASTVGTALTQINALTTATGTLTQNTIVFSTNIADGQVNGLDIAPGTIASSQTVPGQFILSTSTLWVGTTYYVSSGTVQGNQVVVGSQTVMGLFTSTTGMIVGGSTVTGNLYVDKYVQVSSLNVTGTIKSTTGFIVNGATVTTITFPDGTIQVTAPSASAGSGNNQGTNTSTMTLTIMRAGGPVYLATSPFVAIPGQVYNFGTSTFNVTDMRAFTSVPSSSTAESAVTFRLAFSTWYAGGSGPSPTEYRSSSATLQPGERFGTWASSGFQIRSLDWVALHITSMTTGPTTPGENFGLQIKGWYSPLLP